MKIFIVFLLILSKLFANDTYVIVINKKSAIQSISKKSLQDIYLAKKYFIQDVKIIPINLPANSDLRKVFEKRIIGVQREQLNGYWVKQHFQGISPPATQASVNSMKSFIKNVHGAIGYMPNSMVDENLRVIYEF